MKQGKRKLQMVHLMVFFCLSAVIGCNRGEDEIYLLPDNYEGAVYIIFDQKTGELPKYEGGKRVYEIPSNGILKTQFGFNDGWTHFPQFYHTDGKNRKSVFYQIEIKDIREDTLQACCVVTGNAYKATNEAVAFERFFIGTKRQVDSLFVIDDKLDVSKYGE